MKLLALDTSTEACSAAVYADGATFSEFELTPRAHTQLILPMVEKVLAAAGLTFAGCGCDCGRVWAGCVYRHPYWRGCGARLGNGGG